MQEFSAHVCFPSGVPALASFALHVCPHTTLLALHVCPHTTLLALHVCPHTTLLALHVCPHTTLHVSSHYHICALKLQVGRTRTHSRKHSVVGCVLSAARPSHFKCGSIQLPAPARLRRRSSSSHIPSPQPLPNGAGKKKYSPASLARRLISSACVLVA